jgi:E3 ubiquitin-protein ligase HERC1
VAIRTKKPVAIPLAPLLWKILVGEDVTADDLEEIDVMCIKGLQSIRDHIASEFDEENFHEVSLICTSGTRWAPMS